MRQATAEVQVNYERNLSTINRYLSSEEIWNDESKKLVQNSQLKYALFHEVYKGPHSAIITWTYCHDLVDEEEKYKLTVTFPTKDDFLSEVMMGKSGASRKFTQYAARIWSNFTEDDNYDWPQHKSNISPSSSSEVAALAVPMKPAPVAQAAKKSGAAAASFDGAEEGEEEVEIEEKEKDSESWIVDDAGGDADGERSEVEDDEEVTAHHDLLLSSDDEGTKKKKKAGASKTKTRKKKKEDNNPKFEVNGSAVGLGRITWAWVLLQDESTLRRLFGAVAEDLIAKSQADLLLPKHVYLVSSIATWEKAAKGFTTTSGDDVVEEMIDNTAIFKQGRSLLMT